jgi:alpha-D-ribose 1-methylphosphonate 5-triphosphate synthase subunit PhnG
MRMNDLPEPARRADWLRTLARAPASTLAEFGDPVIAEYCFESLRGPEQGLVMVRARIGNTGDRFNLGEATVTRCTVRLRLGADTVVAGSGHVLGRDAAQAARVARLDALLQVPALHPLIERAVLAPLRQLDEALQAAQRARAQASRVRFHALQSESA